MTPSLAEARAAGRCLASRRRLVVQRMHGASTLVSPSSDVRFIFVAHSMRRASPSAGFLLSCAAACIRRLLLCWTTAPDLFLLATERGTFVHLANADAPSMNLAWPYSDGVLLHVSSSSTTSQSANSSDAAPTSAEWIGLDEDEGAIGSWVSGLK